MTDAYSSPDDAVAVVSISGGKDSNATACVAIERYGRHRVRLVHADTGNEHPITQSYVREYLPTAFGLPVEIVKADFTRDFARRRAYIESKWPEKGVADEVVARTLAILHPSGNPFLDLCMWKGRFPSRKAQFCTEELKRHPLDLFTSGVLRDGHPVESWQGVRRDESANRRDAAEWQRADGGWMIHRPLIHWTAAMTFECMSDNGIVPNPLYSRGMKRVGCMPCINCGKDELNEIANRWPEEINRIREWEAIVADASKRGLASFFFLAATGGSDEEDAAANSIDNVVTWSRTSRGGRQLDMERSIPSPECSSVYGLCE